MDVLFVVAIPIGLVFVWATLRVSWLHLLGWAEREGLEVVEATRCLLWRGPFFLHSTSAQAVFRIEVVDRRVLRRLGYARVGGWFFGMFSDQVTVSWDP